MRIGINASFLSKPGTGIGQVTLYFLKTLATRDETRSHEYVLYLDQDVDTSFLPAHFKKCVVTTFWKRDDLLRKWLWENCSLPQKAKEDGIESFLSLYQTGTRLSFGIPHIMVVHDIVPRLFPEYRKSIRQKIYWHSVEKAIRAADHIVAVSQSTRNDLVEFGVESERITVAYPSISPVFRDLSVDEEDRVLEKYSLKTDYIYHGGGLEIRKNTERLLRAYAKLLNKKRNHADEGELPPLVISGRIFPKGNTLATPIETLVVELGLEEKVKFLGFVPEEDLPALYKKALFFVYPSLYEGFGLPVLEALKMQTPVLTADNSSLSEVAGEAALYIDAENVESILSGMEKLLSDEKLRAALSEKAIERTSLFEWESFVTSVTSLLERK